MPAALVCETPRIHGIGGSFSNGFRCRATTLKYSAHRRLSECRSRRRRPSLRSPRAGSAPRAACEQAVDRLAPPSAASHRETARAQRRRRRRRRRLWGWRGASVIFGLFAADRFLHARAFRPPIARRSSVETRAPPLADHRPFFIAAGIEAAPPIFAGSAAGIGAPVATFCF
jgi:hypothetical protein